MTREDVISILKKWLVNGCDGLTDDTLGYIEGWFQREDKEAFEFAINAIETGDIYMNAEDYNLFLEGYKQGKHDFDKPAQQVVVIPPEVIEKLSKAVVDIIANIDWATVIEKYVEKQQDE